MNEPRKNSTFFFKLVLAISLFANCWLGWSLLQSKADMARAAFMDHQLQNAYPLVLETPNPSLDIGIHELCWITSYKKETDTIIRDRHLRSAVSEAYLRMAEQICSRLSGITNQEFGAQPAKWIEKYCNDQ